MMAEVPFFGLKRESEALRSELMDGISAVLDHGQVLQSQEVAEFESNIARVTGRKYAVATGSCTDSLFFALLAAGVCKGDEVIVPSFSFIASASCVLRVGANPIFVDVDSNGNMSAENVSRHISKKTKAIIYVHMFGLLDECNFSLIGDIAENLRIPVIEDCAQAFGSIGGMSGAPAGSFGTVSCISFDPTKVISALGSGGVLLTDNEEIASLSKKLRYHGKGVDGNFETLGYNSQMPAIIAATLTIKLKYDHIWRSKRRETAKFYIESFRGLPLKAPEVEKIETHNYHKFVIVLDKRDEALDWLRTNGIQALVHYKDPLPAHKTFASCKHRLIDCANAQRLSKACLSLPCHAYLSNAEIDFVVNKMKEFFE